MAINAKSGSSVNFDEKFDSRLMGSSESSSDKAGALNEAKRNGNNGINESSQQQEEPKTLREAVIAEKREQEAKEKKEGSGGGLVANAKSSARKAVSKLLCEAWESLIPSWGLTLIWINIHVFLRLVIGKSLFCKLGEEWLDAGIGGAIGGEAGGKSGGNLAKKAALGKKLDEATDKVKACANIGESMVLAVLDFVLLLIIFAILATLGALLQIIENPMKFISENFGWVWDAVTNAISRFVS